ncbi:hypothetical protein CROQUDRAFT_664625 [Cronartium quercuum f. sp. fusiforme G11]|uniref:Ubiquinone biosynthesis protein n=1 Tax=Cronartium quercuum f. sp. fusiforme G11 TaxID=708437 RepID=A0A9P6NBA5_9BASI|nr:hypothetical protein CROQUDRAFT_664625 [Cronartium quercuum f. sp. fusiforme G11]
MIAQSNLLWHSVELGMAARAIVSPSQKLGRRTSLWVRRPFSATGQGGSIENRILTAALPFVPQTGFTTASLMAGVQSLPQLASLSIKPHTLVGLFPSGNKRFGQRSSEPIGPIKALASYWLDHGNFQMKQVLWEEGLTWEKDGIDGLRRAFQLRLQYNRQISRDVYLEALTLILTPAEPFFGIPLPFEPPHILPYGSYTMDVSAAALAGLKDYSLSREWMLRRIRMAGVYAAIELSTLVPKKDPEPTWLINDRLRSLLEASESASTHVGETFEFLNYVNRSSRAIAKSYGLL